MNDKSLRSVHVDKLERLERAARLVGFTEQQARRLAANIVAVDLVTAACAPATPSNVVYLADRRSA